MALSLSYERMVVLLLFICIVTAAPGLRNDSSDGYRGPTKIVVGGSEKWRFGFDYPKWALKNRPFYVHDTLVFRYDPPSKTSDLHSVYILPNRRSYRKCDLSKAVVLANTSQGDGEGFEFVLQKRRHPYYFACGEREGIHCSIGKMKFAVKPHLHTSS